MGQYAGVSTLWVDNIYQFEQTDLVLGGPDGIDNVPLRQLADRTAWLKANSGFLSGFRDVIEISGNVVLNMEDHAGKLLPINALNKTLTVTLKPAAEYTKGCLFVIMAYNVNKSQVTIQTSGGQNLIDTATARAKIYLGDGEKIWIVVGTNSFYIIDKVGNFDMVGEVFYSYRDRPNALRLLGQPFSAIDNPRLAEYAVSLGSNLLADTTRLYVNLQGRSPYRGAFSRIDSNTYRLPDLRGVAIRALDLGAGLDYSRLWEQAGGYEHDSIGEHFHPVDDAANVSVIKRRPGGPGGGLGVNSVNGWEFTSQSTGKFGSRETAMKNIGLIPYIKA